MKLGQPAIPSSPLLREDITRFIVTAVKPYVDEKGLSVGGLRLYIVCKDRQEEENIEIALRLDKKGWFQKEQLERKFMDQYISLEENWFFECKLVAELPQGMITQGVMAIEIVRSSEARTKFTGVAQVLALKGQTSADAYALDPATQNKFYIGRTQQPQLASGRLQTNHIVFLGEGDPGYDPQLAQANQHVSRNHAVIVYDSRTDKYLLYADKGGLPESGNKLKVHTYDERLKLLNAAGIAHELHDGDQIELGGRALLLFTRK